MNTANMTELQLPFAGFYCSIWEALIESEEQSDIDWVYEENGTTEKQQLAFSDYLWRHIDYSTARENICKAYVSAFGGLLSEKLGENVVLEYSGMTSPREYNFTTDRLFARTSLATLEKVLALPEVQERLPAMLIRNHKSRDGFCSFMSHNMGEGCWALPVSEWDCNQWNTVLDCLFDGEEEYRDFEEAAYEDIGGNGEVDLGISRIYTEWLEEYNAEICLDNEQLNKVIAAINTQLKPGYRDNFLVIDALTQELTRDCEELELSYLHTLSGNYEKLYITDILGEVA